MAIKRHKRGNSVYICEYKQIREGKKVRSVFLRYLGKENELKNGKKPKKRVLDRLNIQRSTRAGDVRLLWSIAKDLGFFEIIDRFCCSESSIKGPSPGKFLTVWAINRVLDPESCTQLERWVATTDLPILTGIKEEEFSKDAFLSSLDFVCYRDRASNRLIDYSASIDDTLYQKWRAKHPLQPGEKETVAYDLTSVLFFGVTCPIAELAYNPKKVKRKQVNLALMASKWDKFPIAHFVYNGKRNSSSTVKNLLARLKETAIEPGTIIWDRGNVSKTHVKNVESTRWKLICGVPKSSKEVCNLIDKTDVPVNPNTFIHKSRSEHIYAIRTKGSLFGRERSVVVYINQDQRNSEINAQNEALAEIGKEIDALSRNGKDWSESELHKQIKAIVGDWKDYVHTPVRRKGDGARIEWSYRTRKMDSFERSCGKYLLLSTDESLSSQEVVKSYFEKDFIEKVFRTLKTYEKLEPVRHRLEHRVRAYVFVCVLAYRLLAALRWRFDKGEGKEGVSEKVFELLAGLGRVERVEVGFGREVKTWYLNKTKEIEKMLKMIGMKDLLKEEVRLEV